MEKKHTPLLRVKSPIKQLSKKVGRVVGLVIVTSSPCFAIENLSDQQLAKSYFNDLPLSIDTDSNKAANNKDTERQQASDTGVTNQANVVDSTVLTANQTATQPMGQADFAASVLTTTPGTKTNDIVASLINETNSPKFDHLVNTPLELNLNDPNASINLLGALGINNLSDEVKAKLQAAQNKALLQSQNSDSSHGGMNSLANSALGGLLNQIIIKSVGLTPFSYRFKGNTAQIIMQPKDVIVDYYYGRINNETDFELVNINAGIREISVTYSR